MYAVLYGGWQQLQSACLRVLQPQACQMYSKLAHFAAAACCLRCLLVTITLAQARLSPAASMHLSVEVPAMDLSLVDGRPQELLLLTLDGLTLEYHAGNSAGVSYNQVRQAAGHCETLHSVTEPVW
jgi:hypothetical protein